MSSSPSLSHGGKNEDAERGASGPQLHSWLPDGRVGIKNPRPSRHLTTHHPALGFLSAPWAPHNPTACCVFLKLSLPTAAPVPRGVWMAGSRQEAAGGAVMKGPVMERQRWDKTRGPQEMGLMHPEPRMGGTLRSHRRNSETQVALERAALSPSFGRQGLMSSPLWPAL